MKSAFEQIRVLLELKEKGSISEEEFKQMLSILENESAKNTKDSVVKGESLKEISPVEEYEEHIQELASEKEDVNIAQNNTPEEDNTNPKPDVEEQSIQIDDHVEETKPIDEQVVQADWVELNSSNTIPFYKQWTRKQWILIVLGLFFLSFISKRPNFIWDKDSDGVYNWSDICPEKAGSVKCYGCPDKDNDGTTDNLDLNISDQDHDHIPDINDKCPDVWGPLENKGCPTSRQIPKRNRTKEDISKGTINTMNFKNLKRIFGLNFIRLNKKKYEISDKEFEGFKPITKKEQIDALNKEFGLNISNGSTSIDKSQSTNSSNNGSISFPFSKVNEAKLALNDLQYVTNLTNQEISILQEKIKVNCDDYFNGVISGKYKEDPSKEKELRTILKNALNISMNPTNSRNGKKVDFPQKTDAENAFNNFKNATSDTDKVKYRKAFKTISNKYFDGCSSGKYNDDETFSKYLKKCLITLDLY